VYVLCSSSLRSFLYPLILSLLGLSILLRTLFSNACSSLRMKYQVSHHYKTSGITFSGNFIFMGLDRRQTNSELNGSKPSPNLISLQFLYECNLILSLTVTPKYLNPAAFSKNLLALCVLWYFPFWWRGIKIYLVFSALTSTPTSLLAYNSFCFSLYHVYVSTI